MEQPVHRFDPRGEKPCRARRDVHAQEEVGQDAINRAGAEQGYSRRCTRNRENSAGLTGHSLGAFYIDQHRTLPTAGNFVDRCHGRMGISGLQHDSGVPRKVNHPICTKFYSALATADSNWFHFCSPKQYVCPSLTGCLNQWESRDRTKVQIPGLKPVYAEQLSRPQPPEPTYSLGYP